MDLTGHMIDFGSTIGRMMDKKLLLSKLRDSVEKRMSSSRRLVFSSS